MAKVKVSAAAAARPKRQLLVRERQFLHAALGSAVKIETDTPGVIHSTDFVMDGRKLSFKITWNRDRGLGDGDAESDSGDGKPSPARRRPNKPAARKAADGAAGTAAQTPAHKAGKEACGSSRKRRGGTADKQSRAADAHGSTTQAADRVAEPVPTDPTAPISKVEAEEMRSAIAHRVAHHAQAAGLAAGDDGARLLGDSQPLKLGTHKVRGVRLLRDSPAADLSADMFNAAVEKIICTARPRGGIRTGAPLDDQSMAQLDELLVPPAGATLPSHNEMEHDGYELFK